MNAHVIVLGNEKGGSGKSTTAFHLAIFLLYAGFKVASIDVDSRQQTLTRYVLNRRKWAKAHDLRLPHPTHYHLPVASGDSMSANHRAEFNIFRQAVVEVEGEMDFIIIDTPGFDTNLSRLAHSLADTLVTPLNDSLIDLDVLAEFDAVTGSAGALSHYAKLAQRARKERLAVDGHTIDWILVRNRISMLSSRNMRQVQNGLRQIATRLGCRLADGIAERVAFRGLFSTGMTVFDPVGEDMLGGMSMASQESARNEYRQLIELLNLPVSERAAARFAWQKSAKSGANYADMFVHSG